VPGRRRARAEHGTASDSGGFPGWSFPSAARRGDVAAGARAAAHAGNGDGVDGAVESPVAAAVEPVPDGLTASSPDRAGAAERGEGGLVAAPAWVESPSQPSGRSVDRTVRTASRRPEELK
jgi:hypothetical protein